MLNLAQAKKALLTKEPSVVIQKHVIYRDVYLFRVRFASVAERDFDPYFSVNMMTGEVKDFSILHDGDIQEIIGLFLKST